MAGNIARRADGRWRARYRDPAHREHARHFNRKVDAERWLASVEVSLARGEWLDPSLGKVRLADWSEQWLAGQVQLKLSTRRRYERLLARQILPAWGDVPLTAVTHAAVGAWVGGLVESGLSASSARQAYRVLSLMLALAVRDRRLPSNPAEGVRLPRPAKPEKRFLTHQEVGSLIEAAGSGGLIVAVLAYCGLRWGELAGLRVKRLDRARRRLIVVEAASEVDGVLVWGTPKSHQRRSVPVPQFLWAELVDHVDGEEPDDLVFSAPHGGVLRNHNFRRDTFDPAVERAGLHGLTPHELRHTAASLAVAAGANVKAVQRMLGHYAGDPCQVDHEWSRYRRAAVA